MKRQREGPSIDSYMIKPKASKGNNEGGEDESSDKRSQGGQRRNALRDIAAGTLDAIKHGSYLQHNLSASVALSKQNTKYYSPNSLLSTWETARPSTTYETHVSLLEVSTLDGARLLANASASANTNTDPSHDPSSGSHSLVKPRIGVLNFASAKKPGGGFLGGAQAQEESIARSSTLYPTLMTSTAQQFYTLHNRDARDGYYSHAMIYSPGVVLFRDDHGDWTDPLAVDVLTSPAVNAGVVKRKYPGSEAEEAIRKAMKERMGRILFLLEKQGVQEVVLGSFGTGVFRNSVDEVARIWVELILVPNARFGKSFKNVLFAVLGTETFQTFQEVFVSHGVS
ncbi:hypothetical protein BDW22DRAFT_1355889 [Trametopsis cervina]|nr:hypothetical protein BDW22DRAFT_1355889 [Trametopsis cervina]